ncbi:bifunctional 4-hydroxy-2-oxoglutarate aldolase/2-dehydro-3-deoxy-phosphogluconate aldolase [Parafilimonas sp.]|uniref:bifunctional 4-hydroxy-2-oxoglutarate aldolase/2-dehydro-3-deoxy-phosphogluconate aldolase n=1 Tax=Parafilimonas sp. TaxID=1969739 RepID=UPI003F7FCFD0
MTSLSQIFEHKIVAILRGMPPAEITNIANALYNGGIRLLEITLNSENTLPAIEQLNHEFKNKMLIGAGTVIDEKDANNAIAAGAAFLISPSLDTQVIKAAKDAGIVSIPGAFTPTEIVAAHKNGADIIKIFPCLNADYVKNILAPLNFIKVMPTGGIDASNIQTFAKTGAVAFGIGSALVSSKATVNKAYLETIMAKAKQLVAALQA